MNVVGPVWYQWYGKGYNSFKRITVASPLDAAGSHAQSVRRGFAFPRRSEHSRNGVGSQQQRIEVSWSAMRTPCARSGYAHDRRKNTAVGDGVCKETSLSLWRRHRVSTASSHCVYGVALRCIEYHLFYCALTVTTHSCHGDHYVCRAFADTLNWWCW